MRTSIHLFERDVVPFSDLLQLKVLRGNRETLRKKRLVHNSKAAPESACSNFFYRCIGIAYLAEGQPVQKRGILLLYPSWRLVPSKVPLLLAVAAKWNMGFTWRPHIFGDAQGRIIKNAREFCDDSGRCQVDFVDEQEAAIVHATCESKP